MRLLNSRLLMHEAIVPLMLVFFAMLAQGVIDALPGWTFGAVALASAAWMRWRLRRFVRRRSILAPTPGVTAALLQIPFVQRLSDDERTRFLREAAWFIAEHRIVGAGVEVDDTLQAWVAASAVMLSFGLPEWEWDTSREILLVPEPFRRSDEMFEDHERAGEFDQQGPIRLAVNELQIAFTQESGYHVGLHEFAHAIDFAADASVDGSPAALGAVQAKAWRDVVAGYMRRRLRNIRLAGLLDGYAWQDEAEFFACLTELFFGEPQRLRHVAPDLYAVMVGLYRQDLAARHDAQPAPAAPGDAG